MRTRVTRREMGKLIRDMLGGGDVLPRLSESQVHFLQVNYEIVEDMEHRLFQTPPATIPPKVQYPSAWEVIRKAKCQCS